MVNISREAHEKNGVEAIVDNYAIMRLKEKHIADGSDHKNLRMTIGKFLPKHRKHRYELVDKPKKQPKRIVIEEELAIKVIMD